MKPWKIRSSQPQDIPFIYSTWLNSFKYGSDFGRDIRKGVFFENYKLVLDSLLLDSEVLVACDPDDSNVILGYIVYDGNVIHYAFIKEVMREFGVATDLYKSTGLGESQVVVTHSTDSKGLTHILSTNSNFIYNPILLYRTE